MTKVARTSGAGRARSGSRARAKLDKGERIQTAAYRLFREQGFHATTTKQVAAEAGVATGTLFLYADDKADLLCMVMHDRLRAVVDTGLATLPRQAPLLDQLMHVFRAIFRMYGEHPALTASFIEVVPGADGPNGKRVNALTFAFVHHLGMLVRDAQDRGEVGRDVEPLIAGSNIFALYFGALLAWLSRFVSLEAALDPGLRAALALQMRGLRP
jgi:AcrR family transcriptional regulator